jgi:rhamnogalacturonyl hydrolase YesR
MTDPVSCVLLASSPGGSALGRFSAKAESIVRRHLLGQAIRTKSFFPVNYWPDGTGTPVAALWTADAPSTLGVVINGISTTVDRIRPLEGSVWLYRASDGVLNAWENVWSCEASVSIAGVTLGREFFTEAEARVAAARATVDCDMLQFSDDGFVRRTSLQYEGARPAIHDDPGDRGPVASCKFLQKAFAASARTMFPHTMLSCYDCDSRTYRLLSWRWTTGIAIEALLVAADRGWCGTDGIHCAHQAAETLRQEIRRDGEHAGSFVARWDVWDDSPIGVVPWLAPNDVAFGVAHGLLPMFRLTGDPGYLAAAVLTARWLADACWTKDGHFRVGFREDTSSWADDWYYIDAGIAAQLFASLGELEGSECWHMALKRFMDDYLNRLYLGRGAFRKTWRRKGRRTERGFTRGYAWALDALLAAWTGLRQQEYLTIAAEVAAMLMDRQAPAGHWNYELDNPGSGACNKGTPILAYHLARLAASVPKDAALFLRSAHAAEAWCRAAQILNPNSPAHGGIAAWNAEGAISTRRNARTAFSYASAYHILLANELWVADTTGGDGRVPAIMN